MTAISPKETVVVLKQHRKAINTLDRGMKVLFEEIHYLRLPWWRKMEVNFQAWRIRRATAKANAPKPAELDDTGEDTV